MKKKKEVIVPFIEGAYYFYNILDFAIYLCLRHKHDNLEVKVYFYRMPFFINRINLPNILTYLRGKFNIKTNKYKNFLESDNIDSLYGNFLSKKELKIKYDIFTINFSIVNGIFMSFCCFFF